MLLRSFASPFALKQYTQANICSGIRFNALFSSKSSSGNSKNATEYRSNAADKLIEFQERYKLIKPGQRILELGSAPGGWTQVAVQLTKSPKNKPTVLSIDTELMEEVEGASFLQSDVNDKKAHVHIPEFFKLKPVDVILSDMSPEFQGELDTDHLNLINLNNAAIKLCEKNLKIGGTLLMKGLKGTLEPQQFKLNRIYFQEFLRVKPRSSQVQSSEIYYLGKGYGLSKEFSMLKKIEQKKQKGMKVDEEDIPDLGFTDQELIEQTRAVVLQMYDQGKTVTDEELAMLKEIKGLDIDWDKLKPKTEEEITKRHSKYSPMKKFNDYRKYYGDKLSFTKNKPQTMSDIARNLANMEPVNMKQMIDKGLMFEDMDKIQQKLNADPIQNPGLFSEEAEQYDPYLDADEGSKAFNNFKAHLDSYMKDSREKDILDPEEKYTPDDQPTTLADIKYKQIYAEDIRTVERAQEKKIDYISKLESGEVELEDIDPEDMEDFMAELEEEFDDIEMEKNNSNDEFQVSQNRQNRYKEDHLKADDLEDVIFKKKK